MRLTAARLNANREGTVVAQTVRESASAFVTGETGFLRLDGIPIIFGRGYAIHTSPINVIGAVGDIGDVRMRFSQNGAATSSSQQIGHVRDFVDNASQTDTQPINAFWRATNTSNNASVLITVARSVGVTGSTGVRIFAAASEPFDLWVVDTGDLPPDTGVNL